MRKYLLFLLVGMVSLLGCVQPVAPTVTLESPANGSTVASLTPILAWSSDRVDASYRLQVATDSNLQDLIIDVANLTAPSYSVPEGKLAGGQTYYWRVNASEGGQTSGWSSSWSFQTQAPSTGNIMVNATFDGASWTGGVNYTISGPQTYSGSSAAESFSNVPIGSYTVGYSSGGPDGATLSDITPNSTQTLSAGGTITFTLNFQTKAVTALRVEATLDGDSWTGRVKYTITGPQGYSGSSVSETFSDVPAGSYTVGYNSGGPGGATLASISPHPRQSVVAGHTATFTLNFHSENSSAIKVRATLNGSRWSGKVNCTISGPFTDSHTSVPTSFESLPPGSYTLVYNYGGPSGATLISITPQPTQTILANQTKTFTLNFVSEASCTIRIRATLDNESWNGAVSYMISGPFKDAEYSVPQNLGNLPPGTYTVHYYSGGPSGSTFSGVSPTEIQKVDSGGTITFTLNFYSQAAGTIRVQALLDGEPWQTAPGSGTIRYSISGPRSDSSTKMPDTFYNMPPGTYTCTYNSGGPIGASFTGFGSPGPRQRLVGDDTITFTLNFTSQERGTVTVNATCNGKPWSGEVSYTLAGPYVDSHGSVPYTFDNCPGGMYTLSYNSGGPEGATFDKISPSPSQWLQDGGTIYFTLEFAGLMPGACSP